MNGRTKARTWNIVQGKASVNAKVGYRGLLGTVAERVGEYEAKGDLGGFWFRGHLAEQRRAHLRG